ncbi:PRKC apoptosis WT1 regulator protein-like [Tachypleus tridentatus]|uniref:PRKC apoptosis WT1 regulator protein-like n=1 Tax=Tachypleus tridentatus TaxID=6853 RepID=UPI003FCFE28F
MVSRSESLTLDEHSSVENCQSSFICPARTNSMSLCVNCETMVTDETASDTKGNGLDTTGPGHELMSGGHFVTNVVDSDCLLSTTDPSNVPSQNPTTPKVKDKKTPKPNYVNKGKAQREKRKLREKRRSTGVVCLESTGGSTGEEDDDGLLVAAETKQNTDYNESPIEKAISCQNVKNDRAAFRTETHCKTSPKFELDKENGLSLSEKGYQKIAWSESTPGTDSFEELLRHYQEQNQILEEHVKTKEDKIFMLKEQILHLNQDLAAAENKNRKLQEENAALLHGMAELQMQ